MGVTVLPPATIKVQVGSTAQPRVSTINYGGAQNFTLKSATDLDMTGVLDKYVITYQASTNSFVMYPTASTNIDNGFF
jgi:hypothetical protein